jgi:hypothetical protein
LAICTLDETDEVSTDESVITIQGSRINEPRDILAALKASERWPLTQLRMSALVAVITEHALQDLQETMPEAGEENSRFAAAMSYRQGLVNLYEGTLTQCQSLQERLVKNEFVASYLAS